MHYVVLRMDRVTRTEEWNVVDPAPASLKRCSSLQRCCIAKALLQRLSNMPASSNCYCAIFATYRHPEHFVATRHCCSQKAKQEQARARCRNRNDECDAAPGNNPSGLSAFRVPSGGRPGAMLRSAPSRMQVLSPKREHWKLWMKSELLSKITRGGPPGGPRHREIFGN
jgi:hypothetical protein